MKRFKDILVFVNGASDPEPLLASARELAARNEAALTLFDVVPSLPNRRRWAGV